MGGLGLAGAACQPAGPPALMLSPSPPLPAPLPPACSSGELPPERLKHKWVAGLDAELAASLHRLPFSLRLSGARAAAPALQARPPAVLLA